MIETLEIEPEPQGGLDDHDGFVFVFLIKATRLCSVRRFGSALCYEYPALFYVHARVYIRSLKVL